MADLIERLRQYAQAEDLHIDERDTLNDAADALEAARDDMTSPVTTPDRILIDAIESEIRQLEGKATWMSQAARIASLRAAIDEIGRAHV